MLTQDDLQAIKEIVANETKPLKQQLNTVEMKVELVNKRVEKAQEDTIDVLSQLITNGYEMHEVRIKKIEDRLKASQVQ